MDQTIPALFTGLAENRTTTEIYLHSIGEAERDAMMVFERVVVNSHPIFHPTEITVRAVIPN